WFAVLGPPQEAKADKVIPHFRQVAKLALSKCQSFLIGGNEPVSAVQIPSSGSGVDARPQPRLLYPGDVLRMGTLYSAETTVKVKSGPFRGKKTVKKEEKFLMCTDEQDREVYLPVEKSGMFYVLTIEGQVTPKIPILRMPDICARFRFPCVVKLLYGRVPPTPCSFTGTLLLQESQIEASVIGCTMLNLRNILLDIPIDSDLRFFIAQNTMDLLSSKAYKSALRLCQDKTATYMRNMKVAYYVGGDEDAILEQDKSTSEAGDGEGEGTSGPHSWDSRAGGDAAGFRQFRTSMVSHSAPSVVEEQQLFIPPNSTPPQQTPPNRKSKKASSSDNISSGDSASKVASSDSPTVMRRDTTFELPEPREVLPLRKRTLSAPSLNNSGLRLLPPVTESPAQDQTLQNGHYMTMDDAETESSSAADRTSTSGKKKPPAPPPKPRKPRPLLHASSDGNIVYGQVWDGEEQQVPSKEVLQEANGGLEQPQQDAAPEKAAMRPKDLLSVPPAAHRVSSIAFADNYLTFPVFRTGSTPSSTATTPAVEQPYETMLSLKGEENAEKPKPAQRKTKPLPIPPKPSSQSSTTGTSSPDTKPVPVPPRPDGKPMSSRNGSSSASERSLSREDSSSPVRCSPAASRPWTPDIDTYVIGKSVGPRRTSYTYYEGYDPANTTASSPHRASTTTTSSLDSSEGTAVQQAASTADSDEVLYENVKNLHRLPGQDGAGGNPNGAGTENAYVLPDDETGGGFITLENPPSMFGYVSPPAPRRAIPENCPEDATFGLDLESPDRPNRPPFQPYFNLTGRPLPPPPQPCGPNVKPAAHPYIHPCSMQVEEGLAELPRTDTGQYSDTASRASCEDDLPLGATFANFRSNNRAPMSDSGCPLESVAESGDGVSSEVSSMSVRCLSDALKNCGLRPETIETLRNEKVDGRLLLSLNEDELREALPGVKNLDLKKIRTVTQYRGFLIAGNVDDKASSEFLCMDASPEDRPGSSSIFDHAAICIVLAKCGSLPCPPYVDGKTVTCAVCSK
ncbi:hypothetical protein BaRGS_00024659, partial [Batillaria attramentaria]